MSLRIRGKKLDPVLKEIRQALGEYATTHPKARIEAYRRNEFSVRVRILDEAFADRPRLERSAEIRACLRRIPEEARLQISLLLLLTPEEAKESYGSTEFDHPRKNAPERSRASVNGVAGRGRPQSRKKTATRSISR